MEHPNGGECCGEANPFYPDEFCTKMAGHRKSGRGKDKQHHIRGTNRKWYSPGQAGSAGDSEMSEGEWQAFGRFGY